MALLKRKLRKALFKTMRRLLLKHGTEAAVALLTGLVTDIFAEAVAKADSSRKNKKRKK